MMVFVKGVETPWIIAAPKSAFVESDYQGWHFTVGPVRQMRMPVDFQSYSVSSWSRSKQFAEPFNFDPDR